MWQLMLVLYIFQSWGVILKSLGLLRISLMSPLFLNSIEEVFCCVWTPVDHWRLCLTITPYHNLATSLMLLRLLCVALVRVELWPINFGG